MRTGPQEEQFPQDLLQNANPSPTHRISAMEEPPEVTLLERDEQSGRRSRLSRAELKEEVGMESAVDQPPATAATESTQSVEVQADGSSLRMHSRSPHPYHRLGSSLQGLASTSRIKPDLASRSRDEAAQAREHSHTNLQGLRARRAHNVDGDRQTLGKTETPSTKISGSPNESGTEADDESFSYARALPAPPLRPRKGLKMAVASGMEGQNTPLLTPTAIDEDAAKFEFPEPKRSGLEDASAKEELMKARARFVKRRRAELGRRASEVLLLIVMGMLVLGNDLVQGSMQDWHRVELLNHACIISALYLLYPIRVIAYSWKHAKSWKPVQRTIRLPAAFDPAPLLYPQFLPALVALVLLPTYPKVLLPNLVLGLSSIPAGLLRFGNADIETLRWLVSTIPFIVSEHTDFPHKIFAIKPYGLKTSERDRIEPEIIVLLYPLHQAVVSLVHYLTTTSLLPAEVHLMSIGLINLLLCAELPPTVILQVLLWLGGLSTYFLIGPVIRWNIALARVPRWRFRRAGRLVQMRQSFLQTLNSALTRSQSAGTRKRGESDADDDHEEEEIQGRRKSSIISLETIKSELLGSLKTNLFGAEASSDGLTKTQSAVEPQSKNGCVATTATQSASEVGVSARPRRNTLPNLGHGGAHTSSATAEPFRRKRGYGRLLFGRSILSLSQREATLRKWLYALYTYAVLVLLILGPIRNLIKRYALDGQEPFGWAIAYLFGNVQQVRYAVVHYGLEDWIPFPPLPESNITCASLTVTSRAECLRQVYIQEANTRLLLCAWCVVILITGLGAVLTITFVEVDTRRKVFHGTMVAMLLPTIPIDPLFISLALVLILALFLILDLLRASQLPPLSRPIATFLTPYVDGRDLRGPVVVSHIFLLIGCAVPLWLSIAGTPTIGAAISVSSWPSWNLPTRDVSMLAGVVCVGMGDAAASLIGRRYGCRKWPWTGGKSLEGSAAFALAVTAGLMMGKVWLKVGGWADTGGVGDGWGATMGKAGLAACGASFMEAVLTGGNDNVVVPVGLWVLMKALGM